MQANNLESELERLGDLLTSYDDTRTPAEKAKLPRYAAIMAMYPLGYFGFTMLRRSRGQKLPKRLDPYDLAVFGAATHSLSRIITREKVTEPLRAAVTSKEMQPSPGRKEKPRGQGMRSVLGELLTCPFCTGSWVAAGFAYGSVVAPRHTRFIAGIFAVNALSDMLHCSFKRLQSI